MREGKVNMDSYIDEKIKHSLHKKTSEEFIKKLEREIELSREFAREDVKEKKLFKYLVGVFSILFISFGSLLALYFGQKIEGDLLGTSDVIDYFTFKINVLSTKLFDAFGLSTSNDFIIYLIMILFFVILFTIADRLVFRKSFKKT